MDDIPRARRYFLGSPGARIYNIPFKIHATFNKALRSASRKYARARALTHLPPVIWDSGFGTFVYDVERVVGDTTRRRRRWFRE